MDLSLEYISSVFGGLSSGDLQIARMIVKTLVHEEISLEEFEAYCDSFFASLRKQQNTQFVSRELPEAIKCPECKSLIILRKIGISKGKNNLFGWKSVIRCSNPDCLYEEYSKLSWKKRNKQIENKLARKT